jgi:hypothetical protein
VNVKKIQERRKANILHRLEIQEERKPLESGSKARISLAAMIYTKEGERNLPSITFPNV